eukprot:1180966-Prorocentrum_minimum.AAC.1
MNHPAEWSLSVLFGYQTDVSPYWCRPIVMDLLCASSAEIGQLSVSEETTPGVQDLLSAQ